MGDKEWVGPWQWVWGTVRPRRRPKRLGGRYGGPRPPHTEGLLGPTCTEAWVWVCPRESGGWAPGGSRFEDRKGEAGGKAAVRPRISRGPWSIQEKARRRPRPHAGLSPRAPWSPQLRSAASPPRALKVMAWPTPCWRLKLSALIPREFSHPVPVTFISSLAWQRGEN